MATPAVYVNKELEALVHKLLDEHHVPGLSIAAVDGGTVEQAGYGFARLPAAAASPDTLYYTGSTTKAMIAAALGRLMIAKDNEESSKHLSTLRRDQWTTRIRDILPEDFVMEDAIATENITIEDALSHRTGMPGIDCIYGDWMGDRPKAIVRALRHLGPLNKLFRTAWQYNNIMYGVLGDVIETVTGIDWGSALSDVLWTPLGMRSTFWHKDDIPEAERHRLSSGYYWSGTEGDSKAGEFLEEPYVRFAGIAPAGSTVSTVTDYTRWISALLHAAAKPSESKEQSSSEADTITSDLFTALTTPRQVDTTPTPTNTPLAPRAYSLGWNHLPSTVGPAHPVLAHSGGLTGFGTQVYLLPKDSFGVVSMGNTALTANVVGERACLELLAIKLGLEGERKAEFIDSLRVAGRAVEDAAAKDKKKKGTPTDANPSDGRATNRDGLAGNYTHPAFGTYAVCAFSSVPKTERIIAKAHRFVSSKDALLVLPVGHRTWKDCYLLQPHDSGHTFFDLQRLEGHGKPSSSGDEEKTGEALLLSAAVWEPTSRSECGASFRPAAGGEKSRMGLRLANPYMASDGGTYKGWEREMAWFGREKEDVEWEVVSREV